MVTFGAIRRLAVFVSVIPGVVSCVSRLEDLQGSAGEDSADEDSADETVDQVVVPSSTVESEVDATNSAPATDSGTESDAAPSVTTPPCTDGVLNDEGFCVPLVRCAPGTFVSEVDGSR